MGAAVAEFCTSAALRGAGAAHATSIAVRPIRIAV
jgi:hypothetical protein